MGTDISLLFWSCVNDFGPVTQLPPVNKGAACYQILGYILQRTDADQTGAMPRQLPKDFFIPDADYDAAIRDINDNTGERARGFEVPQDNTNDASSPSFLADVDKILRNSNLPASAINDIQMAVEKELGKVSSNVAAMVSGGR